MVVHQVPVFEPGEVFVTLAEGVPRMWGVGMDGMARLLQSPEPEAVDQ